jgi:rRNA-processing protein CGR1
MEADTSFGTSLALKSSSSGRVSGKNWKVRMSASRCPPELDPLANIRDSWINPLVRRSHLSEGLKTRSWEVRRRKDTEAAAVKKLENELKEEKAASDAAYVISCIP